MVCKKCKKRIRKETPVCPYCGAPQVETVSLGDFHAAQETRKKERSARKILLRVALIVLAVLAAIAIALVSTVYLFLDSNIQQGSELEVSDLGINTELPTTGVLNIALFGLDDRDGTSDGNSDAIMILSIDRDHNKIKMTSIGRDTLVEVEGYPSKESKTKITHAFSHGGAAAAVKALNQNFGMNIQHYVYVNFQGFAEIIDYVGGVTIDVQQRELGQINEHIKYMRIECDMDIENVTKAGVQRLSGGQALSYARVRKIDSDLVRGDRQKTVLTAAFQEVKNLPLTKFPSLIARCLKMCHTNLKSSEILEIATWAVTSSPEFVNYTLPDEECKAWGGNHPNYGWVWIMDMQYATARLHDFIYETTVSETMTPERYTG